MPTEFENDLEALLESAYCNAGDAQFQMNEAIKQEVEDFIRNHGTPVVGALTKLDDESTNEYELHEDESTLWITVKNISVSIHQNDEGVKVALYPLGCEASDSTEANTWLLFSEAQEAIDAQDKEIAEQEKE